MTNTGQSDTEAIMSTTNRYRTLIALFVVAFSLLAACSSASDDGQADTPVETAPVAETAPVDADPVDANPVQATPAQTAPVQTAPPANNTPTNPAPSGPAPTNPSPSEPTPPTAPAPVIDSFDTPENIDCHNGNNQTFSASWTTTDATQVTISMDGTPHGTYEPDGSDSLPFDCNSSHTFTLTAHGADGQETSTSITLDPRNVPVPAP
jgi:hypothetical protein